MKIASVGLCALWHWLCPTAPTIAGSTLAIIQQLNQYDVAVNSQLTMLLFSVHIWRYHNNNTGIFINMI